MQHRPEARSRKVWKVTYYDPRKKTTVDAYRSTRPSLHSLLAFLARRHITPRAILQGVQSFTEEWDERDVAHLEARFGPLAE